MIKVNQLNKYFNRRKKNEIHVLNDVTIEFPEKGLVVLLGPSGSGKTTLLNVLGGLDKVQSGTIDFDGEKIMGYDVHAWDKIRNEHVGYIFQNYNLLPELSVYDNIAFVLKMMGIKDPEIIDKRVTYILNAVHMYPFRKKKALQLSGGQQQRVAIARALVKNPKVIIADEPTGNLDSKNTLDIMNIIKQISKEKLVVLVTHEKQLATFYGDRILEVKDGRIISDFENESKEDSALGKDDTIFLKDYNHIADHENHGISLALYSDHEDDLKDVSIKLIVKNETLYLDVKSPYNKIKFVDKNAGVVIRDEHYVKKTKEELIETSFESEKLDNVGVERQSKALVSIKQSLWMAFQKVVKTSRKGKLMLFSFFVAGMVIAVTVAMLSAVAILKPEQHMQMPKGYIRVNLIASQQFKESELMAFKNIEDDIFYINAFSSGDFYFINPNGDKSKVSFNGQIEINTHVNKKDLVFGRLPANDEEIMISSSVADGIIDGSFFQGAFGQEIGIWSYDHLTKEVVDVSGVRVKIVGIVKSELKLVYMPENLATLYTSLKNTGWLPYRYFSGNIIAGSAPSKGEVLITKEQYSLLFGNSDFSGTYPKSVPVLIPMFPYLIAGVVDNNSVDGFFFGESNVRMIALNEDLNKLIIESSNNLYIYTSRSNEIVKEIEDSMTLSNMYKVSDVYQDALENAKARRVEVILPTLTTSAFLIGFAMLGFYFVIRSSLISRIYEVSVFRALGVKKNDIFISFLVEIFVLTTITTFIGYSIASLGLSKLSGSLIGQFNLFTVNPLTFVLGLIIAYVINMLAGILPVYLLLRKTPAQILAQYDI